MNTVAHHPTPAKHPQSRLARLLRRRPAQVQHPYTQPPSACTHPIAPVPTADPEAGWCPACGQTVAMPRIAA